MKLARIARKLDPESYLQKVQAGGAGFLFNDNSHEKALNELWNLVENHSLLRPIVEKYKSSRYELNLVYTQLLKSGAGQWVKGHYVPVSTFGFGFTLDFVLRHKDDKDFTQITHKLIDYFEKNDMGPIKD